MKTLACSIVFLPFLLGCNPSPKAITDPNETSEMALMMRQLYDDMLVLKKELELGNTIKEKQVSFAPIHLHTPTDSSFIKPGFMERSAAFSRTAQLFNADPNEGTYRAVVMGCVTCHQALCPGPLVRIDNLVLD